VVDVHANEAVGERLVQIAAVLQGVVDGFAAMVKACTGSTV